MNDSVISRELHRNIFDLTLALYRVTDFFPAGEVLRRHLREKANEIFGAVTEYGYGQEPEHEVRSLVAKFQTIKGYLDLARSMRFVHHVNILVLEREYSRLHRFFEEELKRLGQANEEANRQDGSMATGVDRQNIPHFEEDMMVRYDVNTTHRAAGLFSSTSYATPPRTPKNRSPDTSGREGYEKRTRRRLTLKGQKKKVNKDIGTSRIKTLETNVPSDAEFNERQQKVLAYLRKTPIARIRDLYPRFSDISSKTLQRDLKDLVERNVIERRGDRGQALYVLSSL